jgi:hypothetical protein
MDIDGNNPTPYSSAALAQSLADERIENETSESMDHLLSANWKRRIDIGVRGCCRIPLRLLRYRLRTWYVSVCFIL